MGLRLLSGFQKSSCDNISARNYRSRHLHERQEMSGLRFRYLGKDRLPTLRVAGAHVRACEKCACREPALCVE
jgi:hypothetical protein